ncbi:hypothetical protein ZIOFF_030302 [Zingiber officinale]|uniref:Uncharacterized protein n=1 Tax=Zingiber officinale TaxID=94328 RepID=A0A8J5GY22_ZINOF|nr:hypothetical protein ZIOFF_030302 [Zingiber officinale]
MEEEIIDYMSKKAQKKVAKKLKTNVVAKNSNDPNPFGESKLTEKLRLKRSRKEGKAQHEEMTMLGRKRDRAEFLDWEKKEEEGLTLKELEEFCDDIKMHLDLDKTPPIQIRYWELIPNVVDILWVLDTEQALMVVCNWELVEAQKRDAID